MHARFAPAHLRRPRLVAALLLVLGACSNPAATPDDAGVGDLAAPSPDAALPAVCAQLGLPVRAFDAKGPYGTLRDTLAGDFTLETQAGPFSLSGAWSGCESYVFVPSSVPVSGADRSSAWATDLDALVQKADAGARNTHFFFVSARADAAAALSLLTDQLEGALAPLPDGDQPGGKGWWRSRLHFVSTPLAGIEGWVGDVLRSQALGGAGFAIDRAQRLRGLGSFADVQRFDGSLQAQGQWPWMNNLAYAAHPPIYFNHEAERDARIAAGAGEETVLRVIDREPLDGDVRRDVALPDAATMEGFDRLAIDLRLECPDAKKAEEADNCGAWDYMIGVSFDAIDAAVVPMGGAPDGGVPDGGVPPPAVPKEGHEAARFVTTYHRAGGFTVDATHALPYLRAGGRQPMTLSVGGQRYVTTLTLRLHKKAAGPRPTRTAFLYWGGVFDATYGPRHASPVTVDIPAGARRVELRATITGHGAEKGQCAEFCDHHHRFTINGAAHERAFPEAGSGGDVEGCLKQVAQGAVPNQSGTWWLGRGGWCPGMQVEPWIVDVTGDVTPGKPATITYQGLYQGKPPAAGLGKIDMGSWLVIWE